MSILVQQECVGISKRILVNQESFDSVITIKQDQMQSTENNT
jgi:hypothetical protein